MAALSCRTKVPLDKNQIDTKKGFEKRKKGSIKRSEACPKNVKPLSLPSGAPQYQRDVKFRTVCNRAGPI